MSLGFLAGLLMLGAAGIMEVNDREKQRQAYDDYLSRREVEKKYLDESASIRLASLHLTVPHYTNRKHGFQIDKMLEAIKVDYPDYRETSIRSICQIALIKYFAKMYGYDFNPNIFTFPRYPSEVIRANHSKYTTPEFYDHENRERFLRIPKDGGPIDYMREKEALEKGYGEICPVLGRFRDNGKGYEDTVGIFSVFYSWYNDGIIERREVKYE